MSSLFQIVRSVLYLLGAVGYQYWGLVVFRATGSFWGGLAIALAGGGLCLLGALGGADPPGPSGSAAFCDGLDDPAPRS
jgi:hypothetical protein